MGDESDRSWGVAEAVVWLVLATVVSLFLFPGPYLWLGWLGTAAPAILGLLIRGIIRLVRREDRTPALMPDEYLHLEHRNDFPR
jgi:hypothetical protein